jgi:hypothetical protein
MTLTGTPSTGTEGWEAFRRRVDEVVARHPVVVDNRYTRWFATGEAGYEDVRHLTVQFSVFSHLFVEAQLRKVINAPDLASYRAGKEILMNELGVPFRPPRGAQPGDVEADLVSTEGSVEGARFRFPAAHFEWLLRFGEPLGLGFADLGKRRQATAATAFFCDELLRIYGSDDPSVAAGASYAVEHWAAAGFWKQLIAGLRIFSQRECPGLPLSFWTWHDRVEDQHAAHTAEELAEEFAQPGFHQGRFLAGAGEMLDGVKAFWDGLEQDRSGRRAP